MKERVFFLASFASTSMKSRTRLSVEILEDRLNPHSFGVPWADGAHLTLSFVPDGTTVQGAPSMLFQTLSPLGSSSTWQREVLRAFQTWAVHADLNIGVVDDSGVPLGMSGGVQGDARFGDIRIAARPMSEETFASASPFSWTGTTWSGDIILNSNYPFSLGNQAGKVDLYSVILHEAGHVLGLEHSATTTDAMFDVYHFQTGLSGADISQVQDLYAPRGQDDYDAATDAGNASFATASPLGFVLTSASLNGTLTSTSDADYYTFNTLPPLGITAVHVQLKTSGLSQLLARVSVYNAQQRLIASQVATDPLNGDLTIRIGGISLFTKYYVKVEDATPGLNSVGNYQLRVGYSVANLDGLLAPIYKIVNDLHLNDTLATATGLVARSGGPEDHRFDYSYQATISDSRDVDNYSVRVPVSTAPQTLVALTWGLGSSGLNPRLRVFDAAGRPVAFQVLANTNGLFSLQVPNAVSGATYYLQVAAETPGGASDTGDYFLGVDVTTLPPLQLKALGSNTLTASASQDQAVFQIMADRLMHFALSANSSGAAQVTMTITDTQGRVVFTLTSTANQPTTTGTVYLKAGTYQVHYAAQPLSGTLASLVYALNVLDLSDNTGTYSTSTSRGGSSGGGSGSGGPTYSGSSTSQTSSYQYWF
jgi:hypothetical protein